MVFDDGKLMFAAEIADKLLQFWCLDRLSVLTADTVEMVMMWDEWFSELVVIFPANSNSTDNVELVKGNESAVDAGSVNVFALLCNITNG